MPTGKYSNSLTHYFHICIFHILFKCLANALFWSSSTSFVFLEVEVLAETAITSQRNCKGIKKN